MPTPTSSPADEAVGLLRALIATPSVSRDEAAAADIVQRYLESHGATPRRHGNNVWAVSGHFDTAKPTILLNAHIDTVRPVSGWRHDPFTPALEDGRLYGLGANDCGGGLVSLMQVFLRHPATCNLVYLASCEEEVSGRDGIESALPLLPPIDFAIVGEPTGMQPAIAEKGLMVIDATARGRAGHAARDEGDNAIYRALADIAKLKASADGAAPLFPRTSELLGAVRTSVTIIHAGTQHNVVPDTCTFTIDVRTTEQYTNEEAFHILESQLASELHARSFRLGSSGIPRSHPLVRRCVELGMVPFGSPTLSDQALMRFPSLKLGPGDSARSHTADEYIRLSEIDHAIRTYELILSQF